MTAAQLARRVSDVAIALHEFRTYVLSSSESLRYGDLLDAARSNLLLAQQHIDSVSALLTKEGVTK